MENKQNEPNIERKSLSGIKYTPLGLQRRRDALTAGKKIVPKFFRVSNKSIDLSQEINDLPDNWITKDIFGFRAIDNNAVEIELRVEKEEATDEGRSFCIYLDDGTPYIVGTPSNTFNRNIEQRFLITIEFENSVNELDYRYIENLENNNVVRTANDVSNSSNMVVLSLIDTYRGYKEGDTFLFSPKYNTATKIKVGDLKPVEVLNPLFESNKFYIGVYIGGKFDCRLIDETSNDDAVNVLLELWNYTSSIGFESIKRTVNEDDEQERLQQEFEKKLLTFDRSMRDFFIEREKKIIDEINKKVGDGLILLLNSVNSTQYKILEGEVNGN